MTQAPHPELTVVTDATQAPPFVSSPSSPGARLETLVQLPGTSRALGWLERQSPLALQLTAVLATGGVALADALTSEELSFDLFYLLPLLAVTWAQGRRAGLLMATVAMVASGLADGVASEHGRSLVVLGWATATRALVFLASVALTTALRRALDRERELGRTDALTGLGNRRAFLERAELELERARRSGRPLTLVYFDADHFKAVNDQLGHEAGDQLLATIAAALQRTVRRTDFAARLGGDEFALLFPELSASAAPEVLDKVREALASAMQAGGWPVTFSMGVVTCTTRRFGVDALLSSADALMYQVKRAGRDGARFGVMPGAALSSLGGGALTH